MLPDPQKRGFSHVVCGKTRKGKSSSANCILLAWEELIGATNVLMGWFSVAGNCVCAIS